MSGKWFQLATAGMLISAVAACSRQVDVPSTGFRIRDGISHASTSRNGLAKTIADLRLEVLRAPRDTAAVVRLSDALLRQTRVTANAGLAFEAERALMTALAADPDRYELRRMLATVYLSQHRFREALAETNRCLSVRTNDDVVYGIAGDAHIELGEYEEAFQAFDRMNARKPTAASYARTSYARELQGDLPQALHFMEMATEATPPQDTESLAWHRAQLGHLYLKLGQLDNARRQYEHAAYLFPGHPFVSEGLARVAAAKGDYPSALEILAPRLTDGPLPSDFALAGDWLAKLGRRDEADWHYRLAEAAWRSDVPEPSRLARFLAEHGRRLDEATRLAEKTTAAGQRDIFTADALAWVYFQTGRLADARQAIAQALRTGTRDRVIRDHAAKIEAASKTERPQ